MNNESPRLSPPLFAISVAGSLSLILIGVFFALNHVVAADAYGVPVSGGVDNTWITSAALRDLAFGCLALTFALLRDRRAMGLCLLFGAIIPIGDGIVVILNNPSPWKNLQLHLGGAAVSLVLAVILLRPAGRNE
jgi:hypothetical protein